MKKKLMLPIILTLFSTFCALNSFAERGGNASGGGSRYGIEKVYPTLLTAFEIIERSGHAVFTARELRRIKGVQNMKVHTLVPSPSEFDQLPAALEEVQQTGSAHSFSERRKNMALVVIKTDEWESFTSNVGQIQLMIHEICVLAGIETTGDYHLSLDKGLQSAIEAYVDVPSKSRSVTLQLQLFEKAQSAGGEEMIGKKLGESIIQLPLEMNSKQSMQKVINLESGKTVSVLVSLEEGLVFSSIRSENTDLLARTLLFDREQKTDLRTFGASTGSVVIVASLLRY